METKARSGRTIPMVFQEKIVNSSDDTVGQGGPGVDGPAGIAVSCVPRPLRRCARGACQGEAVPPGPGVHRDRAEATLTRRPPSGQAPFSSPVTSFRRQEEER